MACRQKASRHPIKRTASVAYVTSTFMNALNAHLIAISGRAAFAALFACLRRLCLALLLAGLGFGLGTGDVMAETAGAVVIEIQTDTGAKPLKVEIAKSVEAQARGLMYRKVLARNTGMLFLYGVPQEISMWMRNTYISLDMVFIKNDGRVHRIARHTEPFSEALINSEGDVKAVLEIGAGEAAHLGLKVGDMVTHPHFKE